MENLMQKAIEMASEFGTINLGCMNGWNKERGYLFDFLREFEIPETTKERELGRCYTQTSFKAKINKKEYTVVYSVDSSD